MDKKNTILLTVIAVATLLVAVVGATFAYYSVQHLNSTSKISVNATSDPVGAITLYSPNTELGMTITPTDMAQPTEDRHFYALVYKSAEGDLETPNEAETSNTNGKYANSRKNHIMTRAVLVGGNEETGYTCTSKLKITLNTATGSMGEVLKQGDAILYFTTNHTTMSRPGENDYKTDQTLDLSELVKENQATGEIIYDVIYKVDGNTKDKKREANIFADLEITNKANEDQRYLAGANKGIVEGGAGVGTAGEGTAGATLNVYLETTAFSCTIDAKKAS